MKELKCYGDCNKYDPFSLSWQNRLGTIDREGYNNQVEKVMDLENRTAQAVAQYWKTRQAQKEKQNKEGKQDQGARGAATGGAQMDGFIDLLSDVIASAGMPKEFIFRSKSFVQLPGYFRATKEWDLLVVKEGKLIAAIEAKSHIGSFGNNFNNRTEEAMGSALDIWTAYRDKAFLNSAPPFLGYLLMLEDSKKSKTPVKVKEPHFKVFKEFVGASYCRRYELFCRKLVLERHYNAATFITSSASEGIIGKYSVPADELSIERFAKALVAHVSASL